MCWAYEAAEISDFAVEVDASMELVTGSARALTVTLQVRRYRKVALNVLAVQIWLFTFPPPLYSVKKCLITLYDVKKCLTHLT